VLAAAMSTLPDSTLMERTPTGELAHTGDMLKVIAQHYVGPTFAAVSSVVFAALLLSATNTAVGALVSVQFMLSRDRELPNAFAGLNRFGMPMVPLVVAAVIPAVVLLIFPAVEQLADLYAIGVVGAIAINLLACGTNFDLELKKWERGTLLAVGSLIAAIEITVAIEKPFAVLFAGLVLGAGLIARHITKRIEIPVPAVEAVPGMPRPAGPSVIVKAAVPASMPRLLVPTRGHPKLLKFAVSYAKDKKAAM
jgi:amino acid transporter